MIDYIASKVAQQEHERRVRSFTPVPEHADWLMDDRSLSVSPIREGIALAQPEHPRRVARYARRLLSAINLSARASR